MCIGLAEKSPQSADVETIVADGLLTVPEAAKFLAVSRPKIYEMMDRGELAYVKLGRCRRIRRCELTDGKLCGGYRK
jgi:excisionase family DNA binding protein